MSLSSLLMASNSYQGMATRRPICAGGRVPVETPALCSWNRRARLLLTSRVTVTRGGVGL